MVKNSIKKLAYMQFFVAIGIILFWIYFFVYENSNPDLSPIYLAHERAFPIADLGYITPCLIIGAIGLMKNRELGFLFSILAGSALVFLSILDTAFCAQQGMFTSKIADGIAYALICSALFVFGVIIIATLWNNKKELVNISKE